MKKTIEEAIAKFEAGKTYSVSWTNDDGTEDAIECTIESRTEKTVIANGKRYRINTTDIFDRYYCNEWIRYCDPVKGYVFIDANCAAENTEEIIEVDPEETAEANIGDNVGTAIDKLIITATERPDGTPAAYYVNGVKTRKRKIEFYYANNPAYDGLIEIDHYVARYYLPEIYNNKRRVIFKNWGGTGKTIVTKAAAEELDLRIGRKVTISPALYLIEENTEEVIEVDPAEYAITAEAMDVAIDAETKLANATNANKTSKTQIKEKSPMIIAISREAEKMTISADTGKAKAKKYFVDGEKMTRGQTEIVIRSYVQSAIETGATIEIDSHLANEFEAIAKTPYKGEFTLIHVDENGKPVKVDDEKQSMFADSVDATFYHAKIIMFGDKVPMFQVICNGRELNSKRGNGHSLSQKEVDEWIIKTYQMRKQYPNLTIEVPEVVATLYLDSFACNPRFIRELNVTLTKSEEKAADVDPSEYVITLEAMEIATNAEINAATNEAKRKQISFLRSDIHYREGALKDLEENHLAKYPDDESLKELRAEWLNELSDFKAQLANLENGEAKAVAEAKEAVKERDTEFEKAMTEIRFFAHCMDVKSLKKQIANAENEINSLVRMINRAGKTYGTSAYDPDDNEEFINKFGADLVDELNKLANLKAALAKLAPYESNDDSDADDADTDNGVEAKTENETVDAEKTAEADPSEYSITAEAIEIATNAEIKNANNEAQKIYSKQIIDIAEYNTLMTWAEKVSNNQRDAVTPIVTYLSKFGYTADKQDVFNAIDTDDLNGFRRYISQFPFLVKDDAGYIQKLYVQEDGQVVLAEIPTCEYPNTENNAPEFRYYIKSRRPIAGAVPKGYISATAGEMKAYSFCTDGSISRVPRKVVFGVAVYDHPLSDEQIINYDLHVDPRNPNLNPETQEDTAGEPDEPKFETGKTYYIKDGDSYYTLKVDARTDKMLTGTTPHGTCKYHIHDTFRGEYIRTHLYDDCGNREMIWAAHEYKEPATDVNKVETQTTKQAEFYADKIRRESKSYGKCDVFLPPDSDVEEEDDELIDPPVDNTDDFQSKLAELQDEYDAATLEHEKAIDAVKAAEKALQAARELEQIAAGKRIKTGNAIYHFGSAKAAKLHEKILPIKITNRPSMIITNQFNCRRNIYLETLFIAFYEYKFSIIADTDYGTCTLGEYDTPAQVERVIKMLKAAVARGDKDFIFPTVEELSGINEKAARRKTG